MTITLEYYQRDALNALYESWRTKRLSNPLLVVPTGGGKSFIAAALCQEALSAFPQTRIGVLAHVKELIEQNFASMKRIWPSAPAGVYSAGVGRRDAHAPILFAQIQSVVNRPKELGYFDFLVVDEVHLVGPNPNSQYRKFIEACREINPRLKLVGLTATPMRLDQGLLTESFRGVEPIFDGIAYEIKVSAVLETGRVVPVVARGTVTKVTGEGVKVTAGDYNQKDLQQKVNTSPLNAGIVAECAKYRNTHHSWLCFATGVDHARALCDEFEHNSLHAELIEGDMPKSQRDATIQKFKDGKIRCLVNVGVLTTGFDAPNIDLIIMARATKSPVLYTQMVGRGMRAAEGKTRCDLLDFAGNALYHGPIDQITPTPKGAKRDGKPPCKECPECKLIQPTGILACECGYKFPIDRYKNLDKTTNEAAVIGGLGPVEIFDVLSVQYEQHHKAGSFPTLKVGYITESDIINEYVTLEHPGWGRRRAEHWWSVRSLVPGVPDDVKTALFLQSNLRKPARIHCRRRGKYYNVEGYDFR